MEVFISQLLRIGSMLIFVTNGFMLAIRMLTSFIELGRSGGFRAFLDEWKDIGKTAKFLWKGTPKLETILTPEERGAATAPVGTAGKVKVDVNIKGIMDAVSSIRATSEGDVDLNVGRNLAFAG